MTIAAALLLYVAAVLMIGPTVLVRITAVGWAPRLAITAWLTAIVTVIGCSIAVVGLLLVEAAGHWDNPDELLVSCLERLRAIALGHGGGVAQVPACQGELSPVVHSNPPAGRDTDQRNDDDFQPGFSRGKWADGFTTSPFGRAAAAAHVQPG